MSSRRPRHRDPRRKWRLGQPTWPSPTSLSLAQKAKGCFRPSLLPAGRTDESCAAGAGALSLLPATRGILAAHAYTTPLCACAAAVHPSQQPQLAIVASRGSFRPCSLSGPPPTWRDASGTIELLVHGRAVLPGARPLMVVGGHPSTFLRCAARSRSPPRCRQWRWALLAAVRHQELMCTLRAGYN